ncbi:MAG: hypothetical protein QXV69_04230 [Sulfolobaceae archaeon]
MSVEEVLNTNVTLISASELESEVRNLAENLRSLKEENTEEHKKILQRLEVIEKWLSLAKLQGSWKSRTCKHVNNGICNAWNISDPVRIGIPEDAVYTPPDGTKRVIVTKYYDICITCPLYESRKV